MSSSSIGSYPQQASWSSVDSRQDTGNIEFFVNAGSKTEEVGDDYNGEHSPFAY